MLEDLAFYGFFMGFIFFFFVVNALVLKGACFVHEGEEFKQGINAQEGS